MTAMMRIASFNAENLFSRSKALNTINWKAGEAILKSYREVNAFFECGIDVGITTGQFRDRIHPVKRGCGSSTGPSVRPGPPQYPIRTPGGAVIHVLLNQFKSQSGKGGGGEKRKRQAPEVREIVGGQAAQGQHVVVMGDLNEGPKGVDTQAANLSLLYDHNSPLVECYPRAKFEIGKGPGTSGSCGRTKRLDSISTTEIFASGPSNPESATLNPESALGMPLGHPQDSPGKMAHIPRIHQLLGAGFPSRIIAY
jgi:hypothetical protein